MLSELSVCNAQHIKLIETPIVERMSQGNDVCSVSTIIVFIDCKHLFLFQWYWVRQCIALRWMDLDRFIFQFRFHFQAHVWIRWSVGQSIWWVYAYLLCAVRSISKSNALNYNCKIECTNKSSCISRSTASLITILLLCLLTFFI